MSSLRKIMTVSIAALLSVSTLAACGTASASGTTSSSTSSNAEASTATSLSNFGSMSALEKAAEAEGSLNVIALPHDWSNYGEVIAAFKKKYPKIKVNEANPNASSKEEIDAIKTNAGTDAAPDTVDVGLAVAATSTKYFAPYKVKAWSSIDSSLKEKSGLYTAGYTGIMSVGWNKTKYGSITKLSDLLKSKFAGTVALNGKPAEAGAAFNGFLMANALSGGTLTNLKPGLAFFKKLETAGNLTQVDVTDATIDSGQTGVVFDWTYNQESYQKSLKAKGIDWEYKTFPKAQVVSYYNQAINKQAPHPAAARLWEEFLYSAQAQNLWLKGGSTPVLLTQMKKDGTVNKTILADQPQLTGKAIAYTNDDSTRITTWLQNNWDKTIGN
ncbi:ABC transporter substrate-binding protein [Bifidobacterium sp.]|uniref:ABC transporter substrate-binding protein n=1 Tax=Bifidobacterium sp. TaxID=41200 RepID=UPI0039E74EF5